MKLTILKENLNRALLTVNRVIPIKPQLPILSNVLIKTAGSEVKVAGTNLETGIQIAVGAKIEKEGEITVPGRLLTEFVSSLPSEKIDLELDLQWIQGSETLRIREMYATERSIGPTDLEFCIVKDVDGGIEDVHWRERPASVTQRDRR
ncbi:MAG: hypothetical protein HYT11_00010 [Candidatus Levybacteria bacterium]|nr:hypothetical protein [Candidatus Levybacteria bacterium]